MGEPCLHGECTDGTGYFECKCEPGWTGQYCDTEKNECDPDPCHNGGLCQDLIGSYECIHCPEGTSKPNCEDNVDECKVNNVKCLNGGVPIDGVGKCTCQCLPGFEGAQCQINIDDCADNPCFNHGKCIDLINDYRCECDMATTFGPRCFSRATPCKPNPCANGAKCRNSGHSAGFVCDCAQGWTGAYCEESACHATVCENGGIAMPQVPPYYDSSCRCECPEGYTGTHCEQSVLCNSSNPCKHGLCSSPDGRSVMCTCDDGYIGKECDKEINPCKTDSCFNGGSCYKDTNNEATCHCKPGWTGPRCEEDENECLGEINPCRHGQCINRENGFECRCDPGFKGKYCDDDIDDCALNPCRNGGDCINNNNGQGYRCNCKDGYSGQKCEFEENECVTNPCMNGGTCIDKFLSFECLCREGYRGSKCEHRIQTCTPSSCFNSGRCIEDSTGDRSFRCECLHDYTGEHCELERNLCHMNPCNNGGKCINQKDKFQCICLPGFSGSQCDTVIDICASQPCEHGGKCSVQLGGEYRCICPHGWAGKNCSEVSSTCKDMADQKRISISQVCKNFGKCIDTADNGHQCECREGFEGDYCERRVDPCRHFNCQNNGQCHDVNGHAQCQCLPSWSGQHCEIQKFHCDKNPCKNHGTCVEMPYDLEYGFACSCLPGTSGRLCDMNFDDCLIPLPGGEHHCNNHGRCYDGTTKETLNSFLCDCDHAYEGARCETIKNYCEKAPCENYGTQSCIQEIGSYKCECKPGYSGPLCEHFREPVNPCEDDNPCQNGGICAFQPYNSIDAKKCYCQSTDRYAFYGDRCEGNYTINAQHDICYNSNGLTYDGKCDCDDAWTGDQCNEVKVINEVVCPFDYCTALAGNGKCDEKCNILGCGFDGGDCSLGETNPWQDCPAEFECHTLYNDGQCDEQCNSEACLFDGFDCDTNEKDMEECDFESYCSTHFHDGNCDTACNNAACGFDGGDCSIEEDDSNPTSTFEVIVDVDLDEIVTFNGEEITFRNHITRMLSIILRTKVFIVSTETTDDVVTHSFQRKRRALSKNTKLTVGLHGCSSMYCYTNSKYATASLAAQATRHNLNTPYFNAISAEALTPLTPDVETTRQLPMYIVMSACSIILLSTIILVVAKRKRERATLWRGIPIPEPQRKRARGDIVKGNYSQDYPSGLMSSSYNASMGLWSPTQTTIPAGDAGKWDPSENGPLLDQYNNTNVEQAGPDNTNAIHVIGKDGTRIDQTGEAGDDNTVRVLYDNGCDLNLQTTTYQETPLHLAAKFARADAAKQILHCGANPNVRDSKGRTPLHTAIASDSYGVFTIIANNNRCDLEAKSDDGSTALILAARLEMNKCVSDLIQHHVDVNASDLNGKTALHWACEVNNQRATDQLLKHGANKDSQNEREETPLFLASKEGSYDCVELLLSHFANRELTDYMDRLPRDIAAAKMHRDIVDLLERSTNHMGTSHYEQTFAMNQYQKKITTKKRPRVSAPMGGANGGAGSRAGGAQNASKRSAKRSATNAFAKSSQNLTTLPGGFGSTTLSPPQDHHYMQHHPHLGHFHTLGHSSMNHRAISMAAGLNPGAYGSAPTTPARGQFYQGDLHNQSMPHGGYAYGVQHHVYEQYMRSPIAHAAPHVVQHHRFSMTNNYPL